MSCGAVTGEFVQNVVGGAIGGSICGVITSTFSWVAVPMGMFAWVGAVGGICGGVVGVGVVVALKGLGFSELQAQAVGAIASLVIGLIVQGALFMGAGMTAGAAFTAAASSLIVPMGILAACGLIYIVARCCCGHSNRELIAVE